MTTPPAGGAPDNILSGALLRRLRAAAGLSQKQAERLSGVSQAQISRMEGVRLKPHEPSYPLRDTDVRRLLTAYATIPAAALPPERVAALLAQARPDTEKLDTRVMLQQGRSHNLQRRVLKAEADADEVWSYEPAVPLGVMQTPDFMGLTFAEARGYTAADAASSADIRVRRSRLLEAEPRRRWRLIQTEQAIRWPVRSFRIQAELIYRMITLSRLPNVELGVIPLDTLAPEPAPLMNFNLYDRAQVLIETDSLGLTLLSQPAQVQPFVVMFEMAAGLAVWHDAARELLLPLADRYAALGRAEPDPVP